MTALAADRRASIVAGAQSRYRVAKVAAGVRIYRGAVLVRTPGGFARPGADVRGWRVIGIAQEAVDNTAGTDGAAEVHYLTAVSVQLANDTVAPVTQSALLGPVFVRDDQTVTAASGNGVVAGVAESLEFDGTVTVYIAVELSAAMDDIVAQVETVTTAAPLSVFAGVSLLNPTGTMVMPLPAGRYVGQRKLLRMIGGAATPIASVTGAFSADGAATTQAAFNAAGDQLDLVWTGSAWQVLNNASVTLS